MGKLHAAQFLFSFRLTSTFVCGQHGATKISHWILINPQIMVSVLFVLFRNLYKLLSNHSEERGSSKINFPFPTQLAVVAMSILSTFSVHYMIIIDLRIKNKIIFRDIKFLEFCILQLNNNFSDLTGNLSYNSWLRIRIIYSKIFTYRISKRY